MANKAYGKFFVYALADPDTVKIVYIGRTKDPTKRFKRHIRDSVKFKKEGLVDETGNRVSNEEKMNWINHLLESDKQPKILILDEWETETESEANRLEDAWIAEMQRRGEQLYNHIYSRRQSPNWYSSKSKHWKTGYATSPKEYIERLKNGSMKFVNKKRRYRKRFKRKKKTKIKQFLDKELQG